MVWVKYRMHILVALVALLLAGALYGGYQFYISRRDAAAAALLAGAKSVADYQKVIADYSGAPSAATASLLLAETQRREQKLAEANATLKAFIDKNPKHEFVATAKMAMAGNLESSGKPDEALALYRGLAAQYPQSYNAPFALLATVPILKSKSQTEEARRVCETVLTQYRESYASTEASRYLRSLKPAAAAPVIAPAPQASPAISVAPNP